MILLYLELVWGKKNPKGDDYYYFFFSKFQSLGIVYITQGHKCLKLQRLSSALPCVETCNDPFFCFPFYGAEYGTGTLCMCFVRQPLSH